MWLQSSSQAKRHPCLGVSVAKRCDNRFTVTAAERRIRVRRIAQALWIAWAIIVWNVVFDHVIVTAGREYLAAAIQAAHGTGGYARMDDFMRPAVTRGLWIATAASAALLLVGLIAIRAADEASREAAR